MRRILCLLFAAAAMLVQLLGWSTSRVDADAGGSGASNTRGSCAANQKTLDSFQKELRSDQKSLSAVQRLMDAATNRKNAAGAELKRITGEMTPIAIQAKKAGPNTTLRAEYDGYVAAGKVQLAIINSNAALLRADSSKYNDLQRRTNTEKLSIKTAETYLQGHCEGILGEWRLTTGCTFGGLASNPKTMHKPDGEVVIHAGGKGTVVGTTMGSQIQTSSLLGQKVNLSVHPVWYIDDPAADLNKKQEALLTGGGNEYGWGAPNLVFSGELSGEEITGEVSRSGAKLCDFTMTR
jgi:hypothetical protein